MSNNPISIMEVRSLRRRSLTVAISLSLACGFGAVPAVAQEGSPVRILSVEPEGSALNPDGRLLRNRHPARFIVVLENLTERTVTGSIQTEAVGNLETFYDVARETVILNPHEKRAIPVAWDYPQDVLFPGLPQGTMRLPGARWGHALNVAWLDSEGRIRSRAGTVFAIDKDGLPEDAPRQTSTQPVASAREAFDLRYSGYLCNPAYSVVSGNVEIDVTIGEQGLSDLRSGESPDGAIAFLTTVKPLPSSIEGSAVCTKEGYRLRSVWLLEPEHPESPRARRLLHRTDGRISRFFIPSAPGGGILILELTPAHPFIAPVPPEEIAATGETRFGPVRSLAVNGEGNPLRSREEWELRRQEIRQMILKSLDIQPFASGVPLEPVTLSEEKVGPKAWGNGLSGPYTRRKVSIVLRPGERMSVWLLVPSGIGPFPAVVALHQTVSEGKDEPVGLGGHYHVLNFGPFLASRGFVIIAPDSPTAGERFDLPMGSAYDTSAQTQKDPHWSLIGERLKSHIRVVDYLQTLPFVDPERIGAIGHSLGGESAMMLTAMDDHIKAAVISCGFTLLQTFPDAADTYALPESAILPTAWRKWLQEPPGTRGLPFDFDDCMALWAPRPVFMHDVSQELWPNAPQVAQSALELRKLYHFLKEEDRFYVLYSDQTHSFPSWVQPDAFDWLEYWLKEASTITFSKQEGEVK